MTWVLLGSLIFLALVDSTSFGTLPIPIWLMLAPGRLRPGRILVFLGTVAAFYLVLGLALVAGVAAFSDEISRELDTTPVRVLEVGIGLIGTADLGWGTTALKLVGYCWVMVLPAVVLLVGRVAAAGIVGPLLQRANDWMARTGRENTAWVLGIIGVVLTATGLDALGVIDVIGG